MKKLLLLTILTVATYANSIQVFVSNTMHLKLNENSNLEKVFVGTAEEFSKVRHSIVSAQTVKETATAAVLATAKSVAASAPATLKGAASGGNLIGAAAVVAITAVATGVNEYKRDLKYYYVAFATNPDGQKTKVWGLVVANEAIEIDEVERLVIDKIKKG